MTSPEAEVFIPFRPSNYRLDRPPVCTTLFLHARETSNIGDLRSSPFDYFTFRGETVAADFWSTVNRGEESFDNIIVGGGIFGNNYLRQPMYYERLRPKANLVLWGVGTDTPRSPPLLADFTDRCALIGTRDYEAPSIDGGRILFCPCASAMSPAFDISRPPPVHEAVCFLHYNKAYKQAAVFGDHPVMHNYGELTDTLDFLASGEVVITDSYHGLYWATLLGKKVISLVQGGKFAYFKWPPAHATLERFGEVLKEAADIPAYPEALAEARALNMAFYERVLALLAPD